MASSALHHLVCTAFLVVLGVSLSRTSPHPDLGFIVHPAFLPPVYVLEDPETRQVDSRVKKEVEDQVQPRGATCELNITESGPGLHEVKTVARRSFSFYIKPEASFKKLVFQLRLERVISFTSSSFHSDEVTLSSEDLARSGGKQQWTHVQVERLKIKRRGMDRHGIKVTFGNITLSKRTHNSLLLNGFKSFRIMAEGAAQVLFNCAPSNPEEEPQTSGSMFYGIWVMAGLFIVATIFLASLCVVWVYLRQQRKKKQASVSPTKYPLYEEFDETMLEKIRKKVEALRSGKTVSDPDTVVVAYPQRQENMYVLEGSDYYTYVEGNVPTEHHYEDIDEDLIQRLKAENMSKNPSNEDHYNQSTRAIDNVYESLPGYEEVMKGSGDAAKTSTRYGQH